MNDLEEEIESIDMSSRMLVDEIKVEQIVSRAVFVLEQNIIEFKSKIDELSSKIETMKDDIDWLTSRSNNE